MTPRPESADDGGGAGTPGDGGMNIFCHIDFDRADDCHLYIRRIIEGLADAAEDVRDSPSGRR